MIMKITRLLYFLLLLPLISFSQSDKAVVIKGQTSILIFELDTNDWKMSPEYKVGLNEIYLKVNLISDHCELDLSSGSQALIIQNHGKQKEIAEEKSVTKVDFKIKSEGEYTVKIKAICPDNIFLERADKSKISIAGNIDVGEITVRAK